MVSVRTPLVLEADLELPPDVDRRAPGGAVTVALCGHWEHDGACRWPHHSAVDDVGAAARLTTVAVAPIPEHYEVVQRVEDELRGDPRWHVRSVTVRGVRDDELELARRLAR
jgi:hypothetical protein